MFGVEDHRSHHPLCLTFILDEYVLYWRNFWEQSSLRRWFPVRAQQQLLRRDFQEGQAKLDEELISCTAGETVAGYPEVCIHEVPPVMSPVMQTTGWRIVLTWIMAPLVVLL